MLSSKNPLLVIAFAMIFIFIIILPFGSFANIILSSAHCFNIGVAPNYDGRLEIFVVGSDNFVYHKWQLVAGQSVNWSDWGVFAGPWDAIMSNIVPISNADGRLEVFFDYHLSGHEDPFDSQLYHIWQINRNGIGGWQGWSLGGSCSMLAISALKNSDGRLEVFQRNASHKPFTIDNIWQTYAGGSWSGWFLNLLNNAPMSNRIKPFTSKVDQNTFANVFFINTNNTMSYIQRNNQGAWGSCIGLGGNIANANIQVEKNTDGRLEIFARGVDDMLWHIYQTSSFSWNGSGWFSLGGSIVNLTSTMDANNKINVFALWTDKSCRQIYQLPTGGWSNWVNLGGGFSIDTTVSFPLISAALNVGGSIEVFAKGTDNYVWHNYQSQANGSWTGWNKNF